ncbi:MAG: hypothetical protein ACI8XV_000006 [Arenicella sp.]|jgi:hypothetical protein
MLVLNGAVTILTAKAYRSQLTPLTSIHGGKAYRSQLTPLTSIHGGKTEKHLDLIKASMQKNAIMAR